MNTYAHSPVHTHIPEHTHVHTHTYTHTLMWMMIVTLGQVKKEQRILVDYRGQQRKGFDSGEN